MRPNAAELLMLILILASVLLNVAIYGGFVDAYDPVGREALGTEQRDSRREAANRAERNDSRDLPGRFVPTQGRSHTPAYPLAASDRVPFCEDDAVEEACYASNPPTSGRHLPVTRDLLIAGQRINIPPEPGIYEVEIPREAIPHLQEHAGVFLGYNCRSAVCNEAVVQARAIADQELRRGARLVMAPDSDLPADTLALASWTRVDAFDAEEYSEERVRGFINAHSCRFDPEGFCADRPVT
jgi:hypothetical protein